MGSLGSILAKLRLAVTLTSFCTKMLKKSMQSMQISHKTKTFPAEKRNLNQSDAAEAEIQHCFNGPVEESNNIVTCSIIGGCGQIQTISF